MRSRQVLVTGVCGMIGSHMLDDLLRRGDRVIGVDSGTRKAGIVALSPEGILLPDGALSVVDRVDTDNRDEVVGHANLVTDTKCK